MGNLISKMRRKCHWQRKRIKKDGALETSGQRVSRKGEGGGINCVKCCQQVREEQK